MPLTLAVGFAQLFQPFVCYPAEGKRVFRSGKTSLHLGRKGSSMRFTELRKSLIFRSCAVRLIYMGQKARARVCVCVCRLFICSKFRP